MSINLFKFSFSSLVFSTFCVLLITSCAAPKKADTSRPAVTVKEEATTAYDANYFLNLAQRENQSQNLAKSIEALTRASTLLISEGRIHQGIWLSKQTLAVAERPSQRMTLLVNAAQGLFLSQQYDPAYETLKEAESLNKERSVNLPVAYYQLLSEINNHKHLPVQAIDAQLRAFALNNSATEDDISVLWQKISPLAQWEMTKLAKLNAPHIDGWKKLYAYANRFGHNASQFNRYLQQWQREFPAHPAQAIVDQLAQSTLNTTVTSNITVILPLSGKQQRAGKVAQQGILAAFEENRNGQVTFIDSSQLDFSTLPQRLSASSTDFVIGPLLKENVEQYQQLPELTVPTLFLNLPSTSTLTENQSAISMRPEDEAIQAANTLSQRGYKYPLVISHREPVMQRIATTFTDQWTKITGTEPDLIYIDSSAEMQKALKASLEIDDSEKRIREIDRRITQNIKYEGRNRRDVDMAYLIGSPTETRLMKPFIDVNTSTFSSAIPIFASSRSHSVHVDSSDTRDLEGLVFTEMPWLLASKQQHPSLYQQAQQLWPERSDSLQRIFAMGYDSYHLINKLPAMKANNYVRHYGQTGVLKLNEHNILTRSLIWGRYTRNDVQETDME